jgi:putative Holliday junction resolvase
VDNERIMGLDVGEKRIGIAMSDPMGWTAQGVESWSTRGETADIAHISQMASEWGVSIIVAGLPRNMNGSDGAMADKGRDFCGKIQEKTAIPVVYWDERLTTMAAQRMLITADVGRSKRKKVVDKLAACLILQSYLDAPHKEGT